MIEGGRGSRREWLVQAGSSKEPSQLEIKLVMTAVANAAPENHRADERLHQDGGVEVHGQAGVGRAEGSVRLADFVVRHQVDVLAEKRGEFFEAPDVAGLEQKILVGQ